MPKERNEIQIKDKWKVESLYNSLDKWKEDLKALQDREGKEFNSLLAFKGRLGEGSHVIDQLFSQFFSIERWVSRLYTYAHLRHDEDVANEVFKEAFDLASLLYYDLQAAACWVEPELLHLSEEILKQYLHDPILKQYHTHLEKIVRMKSYTLDLKGEELLALSSKALEAPYRSFGAFNNADMQFKTIKDCDGNIHELSHSKYQLYMQSQDRVLRQNAFEGLHQNYEQHKYTLCEMIKGQMEKDLFLAKARGYKTCLESALFPHAIQTEVYHSLIQAVKDKISYLHEYIDLRKEWLGVSELHPYDLYVPLVPDVKMQFSYEEAEQIVLESIAPLGKEYSEILERGLRKEGWVDRFENNRKRSGAYSSGCYDSHPYILMNFQGTLSDVMTLSHEIGHSMHSFFSNRTQPIQYARYPIFVAEVASTFNEELTFEHLLAKTHNVDQKLYLINQKIEGIRSTLFRQTMFAEFELEMHRLVEQGVPLTPSLLQSAYRKLNEAYFGKSLVIDKTLEYEFLRIPHFYYHFYVYQYATGISAAHSLVLQVKKSEIAREAYIKFLSSGSSKYPVELLQIAGVDMCKTDSVNSLIERFSYLVKEFKKTMKEKT